MKTDYYPYAVVFGNDGQCRLVRGVGKADNHASLLKRNNLLARFEASPCDFVMGRIRVFPEQKVMLTDAASDLFFGKTGCERPLDGLPSPRLRQFETAVQTAASQDWRVFLLNAGMAMRVPAVSASRLAKLLGRTPNHGAAILREITPTAPSGGAE